MSSSKSSKAMQGCGRNGFTFSTVSKRNWSEKDGESFQKIKTHTHRWPFSLSHLVTCCTQRTGCWGHSIQTWPTQAIYQLGSFHQRPQMKSLQNMCSLLSTSATWIWKSFFSSPSSFPPLFLSHWFHLSYTLCLSLSTSTSPVFLSKGVQCATSLSLDSTFHWLETNACMILDK